MPQWPQWPNPLQSPFGPASEADSRTVSSASSRISSVIIRLGVCATAHRAREGVGNPEQTCGGPPPPPRQTPPFQDRVPPREPRFTPGSTAGFLVWCRHALWPSPAPVSPPQAVHFAIALHGAKLLPVTGRLEDPLRVPPLCPACASPPGSPLSAKITVTPK